MASFLFKWDHPASEVYVTGTFDDWAKSVKLERKGDGYEKLVELPQSEQKILYKFVVDGTWTTDHTAPQETDDANNVNNVLNPDQLVNSASSTMSDPSSNIISGVTPQSTTVALASQVPKESERGQEANTTSSDLPGSFPETPGPNEASEYAVKPIPASSGIGNPIHLERGEKVPDPSTINDNTISSTVQDDPTLKSTDKEESTFGVSPLPATSGIGNPVQLQPGEKVPDPSTFTSNTIQSNVKLDRESYEKADATPQPPNEVNPPDERQGGVFNLPEISKNMIPESSLPMGGVTSSQKDPGFTIQSAGAGSTTAALAANVPLEPRGVPEVVQESQQEAGATPEASGNSEAVREKSAVEKELESKVPEEPATSESTAGGVTSGTTTSLPSHGLPSSIQQSIDEINKGTAIAPSVPDVVQQSITESHQSPEAAASKDVVKEKANVEAELLKGQTPDESVGEPAPSTSAALTESAPSATTGSAQPDIATPAPVETSTPTAPIVTEPAGTTSTLAEPPASSITDPRSIPSTDPATAGSDEPPASTSKETSALTPAVENAKQRDVSRSVSPMTRTGQTSQSQPAVTSGVAESSAPAQSKPAAAAPAAVPTSSSSKDTTPPVASSSTEKKSKRASGFFGKLKSKFSDKDKDKK
ncbi:MAG: hypothetical protein Q9195_002895 [Heterodermia aff. obscurata]